MSHQEERLARESAGFQGEAEALYGDVMNINQKILAVQNELKAPKGQYKIQVPLSGGYS